MTSLGTEPTVEVHLPGTQEMNFLPRQFSNCLNEVCDAVKFLGAEINIVKKKDAFSAREGHATSHLGQTSRLYPTSEWQRLPRNLEAPISRLC